MFTFRLRWKQAGGHIHCRLFQAKLFGAVPGTWQKNGDVTFDEVSWPEATQRFKRAGFEVLEEEAFIQKVVKEQPVSEQAGLKIIFLPNMKENPPGKLADAELQFGDGPLEGLKLLGFAIWQRKNGVRHVTFPSRQYSVNGERRSFALLRPRTSQADHDRLAAIMLEAFHEHELALAQA